MQRFRKLTATVRLALQVLAFGVLVVGCTPESYRDSADIDVKKLLRDRKEKVLGYQPQTESETTTPVATKSASYAKLPSSPLPPDSISPIEPMRLVREFRRLGPEDLGVPAATLRDEFLSPSAVQATLQRHLFLGPASSNAAGETLELFGSLRYAVENSRDYKTRMEDLYLAALNVTLERHLFAPRPFVRSQLGFTGSQLEGDYQSALNVTSTAGVRQQLPYGGEIIAQGLVNFVQALNDNSTNGENANLALSASVPFLRGAGMINLEPLIQSERQLIYQVRAFETFRRSFAVDITTRYLRLVTQQQAIVNRRANYLSRVKFYEKSLALYAAGRPGVSFIPVQRALQSQLQAEDTLISSIASYDNAVDDFKVAIGMPVEVPLEIVPLEIDITIPRTQGSDIAALALQYRLDLKTAEDQIDDAQRQVKVAENGLLPDLNFTASSALGSRVDQAASELDSRALTYSAGMTLDLPVDRLSERNAYRRSLISLERASRNLGLTRDNILADVRSAVRGIRSSEFSLDTQRRGVELARSRLEFALLYFDLGKTTDSRDVTDAQDSLISAQDSYERARADLTIQVLTFLRDTGTLRLDPGSGALAYALDRRGKSNEKPETR